MGLKSSLFYALAALITILYILSFVTPWWFFNYDGRKHETTNCWIDGTCRNNGNAFKNNGDAQDLWDAVLILMVISILPFLVFIHYLIAHRTRRASSYYPKRRLGAVLSGLLTFLLILAAVIVF